MNLRDIHTPVLLERCIELLAPALERDGAVFVDATLGMGGHSEAFLERFPGIHLVGLDRDQDALRISFRWLWPGRTIKHGEIERYEVRTYGLLDSGGWGVHFAGAGWTYNVSGNRGVALTLRNGSRLLVGSQQPESLARALDAARTGRARG